MRKKLIKSAICEVFFLLLGLIELAAIFFSDGWAHQLKNFILAALGFFMALGYHINAQDIKKGHRDEFEDDERDRYVGNVADARVLKWLDNIVLIVAVIFALLYANFKVEAFTVIVTMSIFYWNVSLILQIIFGIIEDRKN
ncbi:hypothetical protein OZX56_08710 [Lactobacillus sp. ESL0684]|uniref:hypothetical protein n=1 Tax=Lactobacillus sp. ESL0684 TaxID=2983213 RepID=UPI0023F7BB7A|nr:hypothetical protein [Lactobacillus sp. ESL0684]WEV43568.1 hypothetical protein OZX56_08710 [Lactobacillus sp. ESL0684]